MRNGFTADFPGMLVENASDEPAIARQAIAAVVNRDVDAMVRLSTAWELYANICVVMKEAAWHVAAKYTYVRAISRSGWWPHLQGDKTSMDR